MNNRGFIFRLKEIGLDVVLIYDHFLKGIYVNYIVDIDKNVEVFVKDIGLIKHRLKDIVLDDTKIFARYLLEIFIIIYTSVEVNIVICVVSIV